LRKYYNCVIASRQGAFIINKYDTGVGWQLSQKGAYDPNEIDLLQQIVRALGKNCTVLDIGANIGIHSVCLSDCVGEYGKIYAFEAQRIIFNMLAGNIALNSIENVYCYHKAVGAVKSQIAIPQFDYSKTLSFGSVEFGEKQQEKIGQERLNISQLQEYVEIITIDSLSLPEVHLIKIDVEGMEIDVLKGAFQTINRCQPVLFVEYIKSNKEELANWLIKMGYDLYVFTGNWLCVNPQKIFLQINGLEKIN